MITKLLLADNHVLMHEGLSRTFSLDKNISVVAVARNSAGILDALHNQAIDILLLDLTLPDINAPELVSHIVQHWPNLPVLALHQLNELQSIQAVLARGAHGVVSKDQEPQTLLNAIHRVANHQHYIDPSLAEAIIFSSNDDHHLQHYALLSRREKQIIRLFSEGDNINTIAEKLNISNKTVSTHKARMMKKMQFASNADIIKFAMKYPNH